MNKKFVRHSRHD